MSRLYLSCKFLAIVVLLLGCVLHLRAAQGEPATHPLHPGQQIERLLAQGEAHSYTLTLAAGQYAYVVVNQKGIDVVVTVFGPDGSRIIQIDSPNLNHGPEPVRLVADAAGTYKFEIKSQTKPTGGYEVTLEQLRIATEEDRRRVAAQKLAIDAEALGNQRTERSYHQAIEKYLAAIAIWRNVDDKRMEADALYEVGWIYGDIGQYQKALDSYARARILYKGLGNLRSEANVLSNTGWIYGELGDNQKALETYDQAAETYRKIGDPVRISNIGSTYAQLGDYKRALNTHWRVLEMRRSSNDLAGQAITYSNIGNCYDHLGDKSKAIEFYNEAVALRSELRNDYYTATTLNHLGVVYRGLGNTEKALNYFNEALTLRRVVGDPKGVAATMSQIARVQRDRGKLREARFITEGVLAIVESQRSKIGSQQLRATYFASMQQYREFYIDLLMRMHKQDPSDKLVREAFNASETGRARSLLELLTEASSEIRHGVDPALLERERILGEAIAEKAASQLRLLSGKHTEEEANAVAKELASLTSDYEQVQSRIRELSPQYAALVQPVPLGVEEVQQKVLDADTLLLEYSLGEEKSFLFAVTPDSIKAHELPKRSTIEPLARRVYELLIARNVNVGKETLEQRQQRLGIADAEYATAAANLSQMLLGPVASELKNKRLLIVNDGVFQYVPFAGLPHPVARHVR